METITFSFPLGYPEKSDVGKMHHCHWLSETRVIMPVMRDKDYLGLFFNLKSSLPYDIAGMPAEMILKRHYNLIFVPKACGEITFQKGNHTAFCIEFTAEYLKMVSERFPVLKAFLLKVASNIPAALNESHLAITPEMFDRINEVLTTTYSGILREDFLRSSFVDLMIICLKHQKQSLGGLDSADLEKIMEVQRYILENLKFSCDISLLADKVGLSERKLEKGFKVVYGTTVFDFLVNERMKKSIVLLRDTTMPLSEIAYAVGYKRVSNFYTIFKRKFGYPPGTLRKNDDQ